MYFGGKENILYYRLDQIVSVYILYTINITGAFFACLITFFLIINFLFFKFIGPHISLFYKAVGYILWVMQMTSYLSVVLMNPGIPNVSNKFKAENNEEGISYKNCSICKLYYALNSGANHCKDCDVCIEGIINYILNTFFLFI